MTLVLLGCRADNANSSHNGAAAQPSSQSAGSSANNASAPTATGATAAASPATTQTAPSASGASDSLPITDAAAFRDRLLELAKGVTFDTGSSAASNADAIRGAWLRQYPKLKFSLFYSMTADPNTVSASDTFLISGAPGNFDQLYAFAVLDTHGKCAGGAAIIPGDNTGRRVSNEKIPTAFKPIEISNAHTCTGEAAGENYKP